MSPAHVELCAKRQRRILEDVWPALKTNGLLIYSTCTFNEHENEENLQWLSGQHQIEPVELRVDDYWSIEEIRRKNINGYRFYPHRVKGEGFFLAAFRKREMQAEGRIKIKKSLTAPPKKITDPLREWISEGDFHFYSWNDLIHVLPGSCREEVEYLTEHLKIVQAGTAFAIAKHDKLIPEHAAALSIHLNNESFQQIDVSLEEAIQFLRKESLHKNAPKGFTLVMYDNLPLGWVNILDNRTNNLYPKEWRIRMAVPH